jgi:hypothetical protein
MPQVKPGRITIEIAKVDYGRLWLCVHHLKFWFQKLGKLQAGYCLKRKRLSAESRIMPTAVLLMQLIDTAEGETPKGDSSRRDIKIIFPLFFFLSSGFVHRSGVRP